MSAIDRQTRVITPAMIADKQCNYECIICGDVVIVKQGEIREWHYAHKKYSDCSFYDYDTHNQAKFLLKKVLERQTGKLTIIQDDIECVIPPLDTDCRIICEYSFDIEGESGIADVAYIKGDSLEYIFEIYNTHRTEGRPDPWFELDAEATTEEIIANFSGDIRLQCIKIHDEYEYYDDYDDIGEEVEGEGEEGGIIYLVQSGAGSGKTYSSIQLIQEDDIFADKTVFIYVTKAHSAKDVINEELEDQQRRGLLSQLTRIDTTMGRQYVMTFVDANDRKIYVMIGTIDSFNFAVVNHDAVVDGFDKFANVVTSMEEGNVRRRIRYGGINVLLNSSCLLVIDEAQDLGAGYIKAVTTLVKRTNIDAYVIGDKLQSIYGEDNIYTFLESSDIGVQKIIKPNKVMRFHNNSFAGYINRVIPFARYGLPEIEGICDKPGCIHVDKLPVIFKTKFTWNNDPKQEEKNQECINTILNLMKQEVMDNDYQPHNFMFIFPILKGNLLADTLLIALEDFWDKLYEGGYHKSQYWQDNPDDNKRVFLHKSEDIGPIDLRESTHATRILSIHSAKGNGCDVVFLLGVNEDSLTKFSDEPDNLVYNSLLHVAVTRQKRALYIGLNGGDDVYRRFKSLEGEPNIDGITRFSQVSRVVSFMGNKKNFPSIKEEFLDNMKVEFPGRDEDGLVDWGHHVVRNSVMYYRFIYHFTNDSTKKGISSVIRKLNNKLGHSPLISKSWEKRPSKSTNNDHRGYFEALDEFKNGKSRFFPLLIVGDVNSRYRIYGNIMKKIILWLQSKMKYLHRETQFPDLCPLEMVVYSHMISTAVNGQYCTVKCMDVYDVIRCYDFTMLGDSGCSRCKQHFTLPCELQVESKSTKIAETIVRHYEDLTRIDKAHKLFESEVDDDFEYGIARSEFDGKAGMLVISMCTFVAESPTTIMPIILRPQLNEMNYNSVMCEILLIAHSYVYKKKEIVCCLFTLDCDKPRFFRGLVDHPQPSLQLEPLTNTEEPVVLDMRPVKDTIERSNFIDEIIGKYLHGRYSICHKYIYDFMAAGLLLNNQKRLVLPGYIVNALDTMGTRPITRDQFIEYLDEQLALCLA